MPRRGRGLLPASGSNRRQTGWSVGPGSSVPVGVSASGSLILGSGVGANIQGLTLIRVRGHVELVLRLAGASEGFTGAIGICLVTDDAFAIGITAMPTPVTDMEDDIWLYHRFFSVHAGAVTATAALARISESWEVDSKAMRKTPQGTTLAAVFEATEVGTSIIDVTFQSRLLDKLP